MSARVELVRSICEGCKANRGRIDDTHQHCEAKGCKKSSGSVNLLDGKCPLNLWNSKFVGSDRANPAAVRATKGKGKGRTLVIVANGPSKKGADLERLVNHPEIDIAAINVPDQRVWPPKFWFISDFSQYRANARQFALYSRMRWGKIFLAGANVKGPACIQLAGSDHFSLDPSAGVHVGGTTTNVSLQMALYWDYDRVFIFGLDMCSIDGKLYEWGHHKVFGPKFDHARTKNFPHEAETLWAACDAMGKFRNRVTVCSRHNRWPFVARLNRLDEREAVDLILSSPTSRTQDRTANDRIRVEKHPDGWREAWRRAIDSCKIDDCVLTSDPDLQKDLGSRLALAGERGLSTLAIHGWLRSRVRPLFHDRVPESEIVARILRLARNLSD